MNCFRHSDRVAVGVCKSCGKGVCLECAVSRTNGIACKGECEERVDLLNRILDNNARTLSAARYQTRSQGLLSLAFGIIFLIFAGAWALQEGNVLLSSFFACGGVLLVITGIVRLNRKSEYPRPEK
jgi:hypothetical protein